MADDRPEDIGPPADLGRPRRAPPTIDLPATEVSGKSASEVGGKPATETGETADAGETAGEARPGAVARAPWLPSALVSAAAGAGAALLVIAIVWLAGWPGEPVSPAAVAPQADNAAIGALAARVANIERAANGEHVANAGAPPDPAVAPRVEALEKSIASLRDELATSRSRTERLIAAVNELKSAPRDAPQPPNLSAINERIAQIERTTRAQIAETAQQRAKPADDTPLRRVVAATLLDVSVRQGEPYAEALDAAKALADDAAVLKPLDPFAVSGVPSPTALSRDLLALLAKLAPARETATTAGGGILDRLQAGAARLVRIHRTDAADGNDPTAAVTRAAAAAQRSDLAGARHELNTLPPADRAAVQSWIDRLDARETALAVSRQFAADATAALARSAP